MTKQVCSVIRRIYDRWNTKFQSTKLLFRLPVVKSHKTETVQLLVYKNGISFTP